MSLLSSTSNVNKVVTVMCRIISCMPLLSKRKILRVFISQEIKIGLYYMNVEVHVHSRHMTSTQRRIDVDARSSRHTDVISSKQHRLDVDAQSWPHIDVVSSKQHRIDVDVTS